MQTDLDAYFEHLRTERQVSPHTLDGYRRDLVKVLSFCEKQRLPEWGQLKSPHERQLIAEQHRLGQSGRSLARL